jgi:hypothetical protein
MNYQQTTVVDDQLHAYDISVIERDSATVIDDYDP